MIRQVLIDRQFNRKKLLSLLNRQVLGDEEKLKVVRSILKQVSEEGDKALLRILKEVEGQDFSAEDLAVDPRTVKNSIGKIDSSLYRSLKLAANRIRAYHIRQVPKGWFLKEKGLTSGFIVRPLDRVGIYVPGGGASYPSTLLMNAIPAQIAGVKEIIICTPADLEGKVSNAVLSAASILNIRKVFKVGGAQAIAAMAFGTETIPKVDKVTGPGNIYVTLAKKEVTGIVGIDMLAGPSEVLIVADEFANPQIVAADMLAQSEHGSDAMAILLTDSQKLATGVQKELDAQLKRLSREAARKSLANFGLILMISNLLTDKAIETINNIAAEHLLIYTKRPKSLLPKIKTAGAIFIGQNSAVALGDYAAGPNHTLPTMGNATFSSPLSVEDFVKKSNYLEVEEEGLRKLAGTVETIAKAEGLEAHAYSVELRRKLIDDEN